MAPRAKKTSPFDLAQVGERVERLRVALDVEKGDFARTGDIDPSTYSKIIQGERPLRVDMAYLLAQRWGVTMDYFYFGRLTDLPESLASKLRRN